MSKIFIDPGHGAHDPGAVGKHSKEKDNVLKVGLRLKALLEKQGHEVMMSRTTDVFIPLATRAAMANAWGADYFVSLHNNSAVSSASGFETFIYNGSKQTATQAFQTAIHNAIAPQIGIVDRGKKSANFAVLRLTAMPAVLVEYAFISNSDDESILTNKVEQMAQWTANGIIDYVGKGKTPAAKPKPSKPSETKPSTTEYEILEEDGFWGKAVNRRLQQYFGTQVDGRISEPSALIMAMQKWLGTPVDGYISKPYSTFIAALQKRMGTYVDGKISRPSSMVLEMQRRLNKGKL